VLHLWSLGIEEQFYLIWPTLMLLTCFRGRSSIILACTLLGASFAWNLLLSRSDPMAAFFLPTTRFWELMVGCVLALSLPSGFSQMLPMSRWHHSAARVFDAASVLGILLIVVAAILIRSAGSFFGWWALMPTIGAALLIAAGPDALVNRQLLSRPLFVWLGLISYPLYLWHWPILAFIRHYHLTDRPSDLMRWGCIALSIVLADWTYRFVEKPVRHGALTASKPIGAAFAMALIGLAAIAVFANRGYEERFPKEIAALFKGDNKATELSGSGFCMRADRQNEIELTNDCERTSTADLNQFVLVWGDSHAAHLVPGLTEIERVRQTVRFMFFVQGGCPPLLSYKSYKETTDLDCPLHNRAAIDKIGLIKPDAVILAADWSLYDARTNLSESIQDVVYLLKSVGIKRIVGVGQFPLFDYAVPRIIARQYRLDRISVSETGAVAPIRSTRVEPQTFILDQSVRQSFQSAGGMFVSPPSTLCDEHGCLLSVPGRADPIDFDSTHLTKAGSIWFVTHNEMSLLGGQY
jgi:hypothetical protein